MTTCYLLLPLLVVLRGTSSPATTSRWWHVLLAVTVIVASSPTGVDAQQLLRPQEFALVTANTTAVTVSETHCAVPAPPGRLAAGALGLTVPYSVAVAAVEFIPDGASSSVPASLPCGGTSATPALKCGSTYAAAFYCQAPAAGTSDSLAASGASTAQRLVAISQDTAVAGEYTDGRVVLDVHRRLQANARCTMSVVHSPSLQQQSLAGLNICGRVVFHLAGVWGSLTAPSTQMTENVVGTTPFVPRTALATPSTSTLPSAVADGAGWVTGVMQSTGAVVGHADGHSAGEPGVSFVEDVAALATATIGGVRQRCGAGADVCVLVHMPASHRATYDAVRDQFLFHAATTPASSFVAAVGSCASSDGGSIPSGSTLVRIDDDASAARVLALVMPIARATGPILVHDARIAGSFTAAFADPSQSNTSFSIATTDAASTRAVCTIPRAQMPATLAQVVRRVEPCGERLTRGTCDGLSGNRFCRFNTAATGVGGTCCWNGIFLGPNATQAELGVGLDCANCRSTGPVLSPPSVWDTSCRVNQSSLYLRNIAGLRCQGRSSPEACIADHFRCGSADVDGIITANNALAQSCLSIGTCLDPSRPCIPAPSTLPPTPAPTLPEGTVPATTPVPQASRIPMQINVSRLYADDVRDLGVPVAFTVSSLYRNTRFNRSITVADLEALIVVDGFDPREPETTRFNIEQRTSPLITFANVSEDGRTVEMIFGPTESIAPSAPVWEQSFHLESTAELWESGTVPVPGGFQDEWRPFAAPKFVIWEEAPSVNRRVAIFRTTAVATAVGLASGFTGWMGVAALHPTLIAMSMNCAPPRVRDAFAETRWLVTPAEFFDLERDVVFGVQVGTIMGVGVLHFAVVLVHFFFIDRMSLRSSAHRTRFPSSAIYAFSVLLTGTVRISYNLVFFHEKAWMRIIVFLTSMAIALSFVLVWVQVLRRGAESYYLEYDLASVPRPLRVFFPQGWWPETRSFTPIRGLSKATTSIFSLAFLMTILIMAGNAGYDGQSLGLCSATYTNNAVFHSILLILFVIMRPFRIPALNVVWFFARCVDIGSNIALLFWVASQRPFVTFSENTAWVAYAGVIVQLVFNVLVFIALTLERGYRVQRMHRARGAEIKAEKQEKQLDAELAEAKAAFEGALQRRREGGSSGAAAGAASGDTPPPLLRAEEPVTPSPQQRRLSPTADPFSPAGADAATTTSRPRRRGIRTPHHQQADVLQERPDDPGEAEVYSPLRWGASARYGRHRSRSLSDDPPHSPSRGGGAAAKGTGGQTPAHAAASLKKPTTIEMRPRPEGFNEGELMHLLLAFGPSDVHFVGQSAFIPLASRSAALAAVAAFDRRLLMGTAVRCNIVGELNDDEEDLL